MEVLLDARTEASERNTNKAVPRESQTSRRKAEKVCVACSAV